VILFRGRLQPQPSDSAIATENVSLYSEMLLRMCVGVRGGGGGEQPRTQGLSREGDWDSPAANLTIKRFFHSGWASSSVAPALFGPAREGRGGAAGSQGLLAGRGHKPRDGSSRLQ